MSTYKNNKKVNITRGSVMKTYDRFFWGGSKHYKSRHVIVTKVEGNNIEVVPVYKNKRNEVTLGGFDVCRKVEKKNKIILKVDQLFPLKNSEKNKANISDNEQRQLKEKIY